MLYGVDAVYKFAFVNLITKYLKFYNIFTLNIVVNMLTLKTKALDILFNKIDRIIFYPKVAEFQINFLFRPTSISFEA